MTDINKQPENDNDLNGKRNGKGLNELLLRLV